MILLSIVHISMALCSVLHNMCGPGSGKLGSHFSWRAGSGSFVLSCPGRQEPRYSCHRRVWSEHEDCQRMMQNDTFLFHRDPLWRYPLNIAADLAPVTLAELLRCPGSSQSCRESENLRTSELRVIQTSDPDTRGLFLFSPQFYGTNTRQVLTQCNPYQYICPLFRLKFTVISSMSMSG